MIQIPAHVSLIYLIGYIQNKMGAWIMVEKLGHDESQASKKKIIEGQTKGRPRAEQKGDQAIFYA